MGPNHKNILAKKSNPSSGLSNLAKPTGIQIALVSNSKKITFKNVQDICVAMQIQITRDLFPAWGIEATITPYQTEQSIPSGSWKVVIADDIGDPNALGFHSDENGKPYALVMAQSLADTSWTVSHEIAEFLIDPKGYNQSLSAPSINPHQGLVNYLIEIGDPVEQFGYEINGIQVSNFVLPDFYKRASSRQSRINQITAKLNNKSNLNSSANIPVKKYDFNGMLTKPLTLTEGGYISWAVPRNIGGRHVNDWWQAFMSGGSIYYSHIGILQRATGKSWKETLEPFIESRISKGFKPEPKPVPFKLPVRNAKKSIGKRIKETIKKLTK